jgi:hypothetical protein
MSEENKGYIYVGMKVKTRDPRPIEGQEYTADPVVLAHADKADLLEMAYVAQHLRAALQHALDRRHPYNVHCTACQGIAKAQAEYSAAAAKIFAKDK